MSGFVYFFPGRTAADLQDGEKRREILVAAGLWEQLGDISVFPQQASLSETKKASGPWNREGVMLAPVGKHTGTPRLTSVNYEEQVWLPCGDGSLAWIGWDKSALPSPYGLERPQIVHGFLLVDDLTQQWAVPLARSPDPENATGFLMKTYRFANGKPVGTIVKSQEWLWELSGQIRQWYMQTGHPDQLPWDWLVKAAVKLIGVNYRVGEHEINALAECGANLLTDETINKTCRASFGFEVLEAAKKKEEEIPPSGSAESQAGESVKSC